jgi:hypothetical protein
MRYVRDMYQVVYRSADIPSSLQVRGAAHLAPGSAAAVGAGSSRDGRFVIGYRVPWPRLTTAGLAATAALLLLRGGSSRLSAAVVG